jgi:penicillin-binding protein 1C
VLIVGALAAVAGEEAMRPRAPIVVPSFAAVRAAYRPSDAQLLDRHGAVLHELRVDRSRRRLDWCALEDASPALQAAVIASEDHRFFRHAGVDWRALIGAGLRALVGGPLRGASTITMQLAAELDPTVATSRGARTLRQKWRQLWLARAIERHWSKREILEAYLNLVSFRGEVQGVSAASRVLFGKLPHGLTDAEALVLAVLLRAPNARADAVVRRAQWLRRDHAVGAASESAIRQAVRWALDAPRGDGLRVARASHVARKLLDASAAGRPVRTTLDAATQRLAEESLQQHLRTLRDRHVTDGAVLVVDNASGEVLAYVGSSRGLSSAREVDGVRARRQAGSTLKPFLYGIALNERLLTTASLVEDTPLEVPVATGLYRPENYDGQFRGLVTVRTALSASLNIPAVRTLGLVGNDAFVARLRQLGFAGLRRPADYYGPALALGSAEVSLWELVNAYRTLANGGVWSPLRLTRQPLASGEHRRRVYDEAAAFLVADVLADRESRSTTFGLDSVLATGMWTAVKTGTSKDMRDNWCVGFSRRVTAGVWVGNFRGDPMRDVSGVSGAAPIWRDVMQWLHRGVASDPPPPPAGAVRQPSGGRATEWFVRGTEPRVDGVSVVGSIPRIVSPTTSTTIAIDPDIAAAQQRVPFEASPAPADAAWLLDGDRLGPANAAVLWEPARGRHTLVLVDGEGRALDRVSFVVRGPAERR